MILRGFTSAAAFVLAVLGAGSARADVLEVGDDGEARWIAGASVAAPSFAMTNAQAAALEEVPVDATALVPESAVADTAYQARIVPRAYAAKVAELAARFDLSPALIEALVWQESRWRADAVSPVGAVGLAQLMPGTARELGVNPRDPFANLEGGARYLREQLDRFDGDIERALAAYNAGPGRVIRSGGVPAITETRGYVAAVMGRLSDHSRSSDR
ncbi:lytic transglycosylase domain-containing protein [Aurantiacibacter spongiae]|uniref:Lytic transglycosylase domain-containing protein n=1 Tax=Aurantiacibacter spongiae TaxID=2488860 RepID=A0A3N5CRR9_9SPHN|nr:lytic transglycosylase domain-containing protein [Aurantiacibacter spongiae]RPF71046.1 lytic transglycosylase domain-containing protein [Aurantiacibacter spongiae]